MPKSQRDYAYEQWLMQLGLKISYYRKMAGLTQEELADRVDVTPSYISQVERPTKMQAVSLQLLYNISKALDVEPYLLVKPDNAK